MKNRISKNDLLRFHCVLLVFLWRLGPFTERFQRVLGSLLPSLYIIARGRGQGGEAWQSARRKTAVNSLQILRYIGREEVNQTRWNRFVTTPDATETQTIHNRSEVSNFYLLCSPYLEKNMHNRYSYISRNVTFLELKNL